MSPVRLFLDRLIRNHPTALGAAGLALLLVLANLPFWTGEAVPHWDASDQFAPGHMLIGDFARNGQLLLWNPWTAGGSPDYAETQHGALSPVTVLLGWLTGGSLAGFVCYWFFIWFIAGFGMLVFARHLGAPGWGAFAVAAGFMLSGFFTGHAEHIPHLNAFAWIPLILWRLDVSLMENRIRPAVEAGVLYGLSALAGYPGIVIQNALLIGGWWTVRGLCGRGGARLAEWLPRALRSLVLMAGCFLVVISPAYAGFLAGGSGYTGRTGGLPEEMVLSSNILTGKALTTLASPAVNWLSYETSGETAAITDISSASLYVGPLILVLAVFLLWENPRDPLPWGILALGLLGTACGLVELFPLRKWLYELFFPFRYFRHAATFRSFGILALAALAALGAKALDRRLQCPSRRPLLPVLLISLAGAGISLPVLLLALSASPRSGGMAAPALLHLALTWGALLTGLALLLRPSAARFRPALAGLFLAVAVTDASFTAYLNRDIIGTRETARVSKWREVDRQRSSSLDLTPRGLSRRACWNPASAQDNGNLPSKEAVFQSFGAMGNTFHVTWGDTPALLAMATSADRVWFAPRALLVNPGMENFQAFRALAARTGQTPMVVHRPETMDPPNVPVPDTPPPPAAEQRLSRAPLASRIPVTVARYEPDCLHFHTVCPTKGWLLVTDRWAPGWEVSVNGAPAPLLPGTFVFRAVHVPAGPCDVVFTFHPFGHPYLLLASWGLTLLAAASSLLAWRRRRRAGA